MLAPRPGRLPPGPGSNVAAIGLAGRPAEAGTTGVSEGPSYPGAYPVIRSLKRLAVTASSLLGGGKGAGTYGYAYGSQYGAAGKAAGGGP